MPSGLHRMDRRFWIEALSLLQQAPCGFVRLQEMRSLILLVCLVASFANAETVAIINGIVVDPSAESPRRRATVLVEDQKIIAVESAIEPPKGARLIDASGKYLVPGLWDMHAHLTALGPLGTAPEHYVGFGVLGVRNMGGHLDQLLALKADIAVRKRTGPDLFICGPTLNGEQSADFHRLVRTDAEARTAVRELKDAGVDFIKIHRRTTREAFFAISDETKKCGFTFAGHVPLELSWIEASNAGMRTIEHVQTIFENEESDPKKLVAAFPDLIAKLSGAHGDEIWATLRKNQTFFDPTLIYYGEMIEKNGPEVAAKRRAVYPTMKALVGRAAKAGVAILAGSDLVTGHGDMLLRELELLVEVGLTPQQALAAATTTACAAMNIPERGRIAAGAPASLLVVDADPLTDITNLRKLSTVVLRGEVFEAEELAKLRQLEVARD
jgi:imidazolonepropionase-like amidohydrolase